MENNFKIGDVVRIVQVDDNDKILGRYVGEEGIYMGQDTDYAHYSLVLFDTRYGSPYIMGPDSIELSKPRTLETILKAFNVNNKDLTDILEEYMKETKEN